MSVHTTKFMLHLIHLKAAPFYDHSYASTHSYRFKCLLTARFPPSSWLCQYRPSQRIVAECHLPLMQLPAQIQTATHMGIQVRRGKFVIILRICRLRRKNRSHSHIPFRHSNLTGAKHKKETSSPKIKEVLRLPIPFLFLKFILRSKDHKHLIRGKSLNIQSEPWSPGKSSHSPQNRRLHIPTTFILISIKIY